MIHGGESLYHQEDVRPDKLQQIFTKYDLCYNMNTNSIRKSFSHIGKVSQDISIKRSKQKLVLSCLKSELECF